VPCQPGVSALAFYGYDPASQIRADAAPSKRFDIVHVGHNWWRWREVSNSLLPAIERIRDRLDGICFVGAWWDGVPPWARALDLEAAFCVEAERFRRVRIEVRPPVPYSQVIPTMSAGRVNLMTQRPLFRHLRFLTSKYFEIFCANTIPLVMLDPDHAESVYGPAGRELALHDGIGDKLLDVLSRPHKYREIVEQVRRHLVQHHSYQRRLQELVAALEELEADEPGPAPVHPAAAHTTAENEHLRRVTVVRHPVVVLRDGQAELRELVNDDVGHLASGDQLGGGSRTAAP